MASPLERKSLQTLDYFQAIPRTGAAAAIYNNIVGRMRAGSGCEASSIKRATRSSTSLSHHQANGVIEAALHAQRIGLAFNRHVTLRLEKAGIPDRSAVKAVGAFLTRVRDWLRKQGHQTAYAWARESGPVIGSHVHILLHLPPGVSFGSHRARRWLEAISGTKYRAGTIRTRKVSGSAYDANLAALVGYLCKGVSADAAEALGLERRKAGGRLIGKRAGWSENVGAKARRQWEARHRGIRGAGNRASP